MIETEGGSFNEMMSELSEKITNGEIDFRGVLTHPLVRDDFRRRDNNLLQFLQQNIPKLTNVALGIENIDYEYGQALCFSFIVSPIQMFTRILSSSSEFLTCMNNVLNLNAMTEKSSSAFSRIFQFMVQCSGVQFLQDFPERTHIFEKLLKHHDLPPVRNLILFLTDNPDPAIYEFLRINNAVQLLINSLSGDETNNSTILKFLINIIYSCEDDTSILIPLTERYVLTRLFDMGFNSKSVDLSAAVFNTVLQLCSQIKDDEFDTSELKPVLDHVIENSQKLCDFVVSKQPFLEPHFHCVELLAGVAITSNEIPTNIIDTCGYLFNQVFEKPMHTFLHRSFLTLFDSILCDDEYIDFFIDNCNMHDRIVDSYEKKKQLNACYWPYLLTLTSMIQARGTVTDRWTNFLNTKYKGITDIINRQYGGPLPKEPDFFTDDDYLVEEEDDWDDPLGNTSQDEEEEFNGSLIPNQRLFTANTNTDIYDDREHADDPELLPKGVMKRNVQQFVPKSILRKPKQALKEGEDVELKTNIDYVDSQIAESKRTRMDESAPDDVIPQEPENVEPLPIFPHTISDTESELLHKHLSLDYAQIENEASTLLKQLTEITRQKEEELRKKTHSPSLSHLKKSFRSAPQNKKFVARTSSSLSRSDTRIKDESLSYTMATPPSSLGITPPHYKNSEAMISSGSPEYGARYSPYDNQNTTPQNQRYVNDTSSSFDMLKSPAGKFGTPGSEVHSLSEFQTEEEPLRDEPYTNSTIDASSDKRQDPSSSLSMLNVQTPPEKRRGSLPVSLSSKTSPLDNHLPSEKRVSEQRLSNNGKNYKTDTKNNDRNMDKNINTNGEKVVNRVSSGNVDRNKNWNADRNLDKSVERVIASDSNNNYESGNEGSDVDKTEGSSLKSSPTPSAAALLNLEVEKKSDNVMIGGKIPKAQYSIPDRHLFEARSRPNPKSQPEKKSSTNKRKITGSDSAPQTDSVDGGSYALSARVSQPSENSHLGDSSKSSGIASQQRKSTPVSPRSNGFSYTYSSSQKAAAFLEQSQRFKDQNLDHYQSSIPFRSVATNSLNSNASGDLSGSPASNQTSPPTMYNQSQGLANTLHDTSSDKQSNLSPKYDQVPGVAGSGYSDASVKQSSSSLKYGQPQGLFNSTYDMSGANRLTSSYKYSQTYGANDLSYIVPSAIQSSSSPKSKQSQGVANSTYDAQNSKRSSSSSKYDQKQGIASSNHDALDMKRANQLTKYEQLSRDAGQGYSGLNAKKSNSSSKYGQPAGSTGTSYNNQKMTRQVKDVDSQNKREYTPPNSQRDASQKQDLGLKATHPMSKDDDKQGNKPRKRTSRLGDISKLIRPINDKENEVTLARIENIGNSTPKYVDPRQDEPAGRVDLNFNPRMGSPTRFTRPLVDDYRMAKMVYGRTGTYFGRHFASHSPYEYSTTAFHSGGLARTTPDANSIPKVAQKGLNSTGTLLPESQKRLAASEPSNYRRRSAPKQNIYKTDDRHKGSPKPQKSFNLTTPFGNQYDTLMLTARDDSSLGSLLPYSGSPRTAASDRLYRSSAPKADIRNGLYPTLPPSASKYNPMFLPLTNVVGRNKNKEKEAKGFEDIQPSSSSRHHKEAISLTARRARDFENDRKGMKSTSTPTTLSRASGSPTDNIRNTSNKPQNFRRAPSSPQIVRAGPYDGLKESHGVNKLSESTYNTDEFPGIYSDSLYYNASGNNFERPNKQNTTHICDRNERLESRSGPGVLQRFDEDGVPSLNEFEDFVKKREILREASQSINPENSYLVNHSTANRGHQNDSGLALSGPLPTATSAPQPQQSPNHARERTQPSGSEIPLSASDSVVASKTNSPLLQKSHAMPENRMNSPRMQTSLLSSVANHSNTELHADLTRPVSKLTTQKDPQKANVNVGTGGSSDNESPLTSLESLPLNDSIETTYSAPTQSDSQSRHSTVHKKEPPQIGHPGRIDDAKRDINDKRQSMRRLNAELSQTLTEGALLQEEIDRMVRDSEDKLRSLQNLMAVDGMDSSASPKSPKSPKSKQHKSNS